MVTHPGKPVVPKEDATLAALAGEKCYACHKGYFDLLHEWCLACLGIGYKIDKVIGNKRRTKYLHILKKRYGR